MTPPKKDSKPLRLPVTEAELIQELGRVIRELAREQSVLIRETVRAIKQARELNDFLMEMSKSLSRDPCEDHAKIIRFPMPPRIN